MSGTEVNVDSRMRARGLFSFAIHAAMGPPRERPKTTMRFDGILRTFVRCFQAASTSSECPQTVNSNQLSLKIQ